LRFPTFKCYISTASRRLAAIKIIVMRIDFKLPKEWDMCRWLRFISGSVLLLVTLIGVIPSNAHVVWKVFLIFMAANQIQSAFTDWCPVMDVLRALGVKECKC